MKLSKREKNLLLITFMMLIAVGYYFLIFEKTSAKITILKEELEQTQTLYDKQESIILRGAKIDNEIEEVKDKIRPIASRYYGTTEQEEFIAEIIKINQKSKLNILGIKFSKTAKFALREKEEDANKKTASNENQVNKNETLSAPESKNKAESESKSNTDKEVVTENNEDNGDNESGKVLELVEIKEEEEKEKEKEKDDKLILDQYPIIKLMNAEIEFEGTYPQIIKWLKTVDNNPKVIASRELNLDRKETEYILDKNNSRFLIEGTLLLSFYQVENVDKYSSSLVTFLKTNPIPTGKQANPFKSYSWAWIKKEVEEKPNWEDFFEQYKNQSAYTLDKYENNSRNDNLDKLDLYGFEDDIIDMKKSNENIVVKSYIDKEIKSTGNSAGTVQYTFSGNDPSEEVSIDLSKKNLVINKKLDSISFEVYSENESLNEIGLILTDKNNQDYQIVMANEVSWRGWKELSYSFDGIEKYPIKIKGIYIRYGDKNSKKTGKLIFDNLSASPLIA